MIQKVWHFYLDTKQSLENDNTEEIWRVAGGQTSHPNEHRNLPSHKNNCLWDPAASRHGAGAPHTWACQWSTKNIAPGRLTFLWWSNRNIRASLYLQFLDSFSMNILTEMPAFRQFLISAHSKTVHFSSQEIAIFLTVKCHFCYTSHLQKILHMGIF